VGGGVGALVAAGRVARAGHAVTLYEQNDELGGRCTSAAVDVPDVGRFRFDTGPSLLLFPDVYKETFAALGSDLDAVAPLRRVSPAAYRVFFAGGARDDDDGDNINNNDLYDVQAMTAQLEALEPGAGAAYTRWLADARLALQVGVREFIDRDFDNWLDLLDPRRLLPLLFGGGSGGGGGINPIELLGAHESRLAARFADARIRRLFSFQDLYVGLSPYSAPGVFSLLAATELTDGVFYPTGGFGAVRDGLMSAAAAAGVELVTGTRVTGVDVDDGNGGGARVTGVTLAGGQRVAADAVVLNG
jgi:phytoene desaturase (3,4-didehydrolycopene-forming)